jgi:putative peptidoglycan lipid II flippase
VLPHIVQHQDGRGRIVDGPSQEDASRPVAPLARDARAVAAGILLSRLAGLAREKVIAFHLGAGLGAEAFRAALRIPNLLQNLLGDGVLSAAFVPSYSRAVAEGREEDAGRLAAAVASALLLVTGALVAVGVLLAEPLTRLLTPGFPVGSAKFDLTVALVRILTPSLGFLVLSAWALGVLSAHRRFFRAYVAPVLWNGAIIAGVTIAALRGATEVDLARAVGLGALIGAVLQFLVQLPAVVRVVRLRPGRWQDAADLPQVVRSAGAVIAGRGVVQLSAYLDLVLASLLAAGAVAAIGYAQVLYLLPVSLFGMSVAAASLPGLSTASRTDRAPAAAQLADASRRVALLVVPTTVVYLALGDRVVGALYRGGAFGAAETRQVAAVLAAYSLGLIATTQSRILQSALYSIDEARVPARVASVRVAVGTLVGVVAMLALDAWRLDPTGPVRIGDVGLTSPALRASEQSLLRLGGAGLALGASVGAWLEFALLRRAVRRRGLLRSDAAAWRRIGLASLAIVPGSVLGRWLAASLDAAVGGLPALISAGVALLPALLAVLVVGRIVGVEGLTVPRALRTPRNR